MCSLYTCADSMRDFILNVHVQRKKFNKVKNEVIIQLVIDDEY